MASEWEQTSVRLGSLVTKIRSGATPAGGAESYLPERQRYALVRSQNVFDHRFDEAGLAFISAQQAQDLAGAELQANDVLLNITGDGITFGRACLVPSHVLPACVNQHVMLIRTNRDLCCPHYLAAWLALPSTKAHIESFNSGGSRRAITKGHIESFDVPLPPIEMQRAIGDLSANIDDRIDNLRQTNVTLQAIAAALFKSRFVDFDGLPPEDMQESELGLIPKGWRVEEIGKLVQCVGGATPSTKDDAFWQGGTHHWATPKDLSGLQAPVLTTTERLITDAGAARISSGLLPAGTLLMSSRAPIGYLAIAAVPVAINQGFIAMPSGGALSPNWLLFWAKANMEAIKQKANGSTFMEISKAAFRPIKVVVPPPDVLAQFDKAATPMMERIKNNEHHIATLAALRDTLLPRLISGRVRALSAETVK